MTLILQMLKHGDHIGRLGGVDECANRRINQLVLVAIKVAIDQQVPHAVPGTVVEEQPSQHTGFGFDRVRRHPQLGHLLVD